MKRRMVAIMMAMKAVTEQTDIATTRTVSIGQKRLIHSVASMENTSPTILLNRVAWIDV